MLKLKWRDVLQSSIKNKLPAKQMLEWNYQERWNENSPSINYFLYKFKFKILVNKLNLILLETCSF